MTEITTVGIAMFMTVIVYAHFLSPTVILYVIASIVSRFWHDYMWMVYLAMAIFAAFMPPH